MNLSELLSKVIHVLDVLVEISAVKYKDEFLSAVTADYEVILHVLIDRITELPENNVTVFMSVCIVDALEKVEVNNRK